MKKNEQIKLIPYLTGIDWSLYNVTSKKLISPSNLFNLTFPHSLKSNLYFYLCSYENKFSIIDMEEKEYILGEFIKITINEDYIMGMISDQKYAVFKKDKLICNINIGLGPFSDDIPCSFTIVDDKFICTEYYSDNEHKYYPDKYFDLNGRELNSNLSNEYNEYINKIRQQDDYNTVPIHYTLWEIKRDGLYFNKSKKVDFLKIKSDFLYDVIIGDFYYGYTFVSLHYKESGIYGIGYIDVYGNYYWQGEITVGSGEYLGF